MSITKRDIRLKIMCFTMGIIVLVGGSISLYSIEAGRRRILDSFEKKCEDIAALVSTTVMNDVYFLDVKALRIKLRETHVNPDIQDAAVLDLDGVVLAVSRQGNPPVNSAASDAFSRKLPASEGWISEMGQRVLRIGGPILLPDESRIGYLNIGFSLDGAYQIIDEITRTNVYLTLACLVVGGILANLLARSISRPISAIARASIDVGKGRLKTRVDIRRSDELGILGRSFNQMTARLEASVNEIHKKNADLRAEVIERKQAETRLAEALTLTKTMLEAMPFGVIIVGADRKIRLVNNAFLEMVGATTEAEVLDNICHRSICPAEVGACPIYDLGQTVDSSERVLLHRDGRQIPILKKVTPITLKDESVLLEALVDISDQKRTEFELQEARKTAETANTAKSHFLANMSHELRTPLNHIIGFTEMVLDRHYGELTETQDEFLNHVLDSSHHLLSLINNILDLSKMEAGKLSLEMGDVDLPGLMAQTTVLIQEKALKHGIRIHTDMGDLPAIVRADERKIKQVLYNLLSNAAKFTDDGGEITLTGRRVDPDGSQPSGGSRGSGRGNMIEISVRDTGIGLQREDLERIFNPFTQADGSASRKYEGTGLGLSLSRSLVELHGGCIWAESDGPGKGSVFRFALPV